jgi:hypothetical protein
VDQKLASLLLGEAKTQAEQALAGATILQPARATEDHDRLWFAIQGILVCVANVSKLLWGSGPEPKRSVQITERKPLRDALKLPEDSCLYPVDVRNSLEHYDERLVQWFRKQPGGYVSRGMSNAGMRGKDIVGLAFVHYAYDTGEVTFGKHTASIPDLLAECERIKLNHQAAWMAVGPKPRRGRGPVSLV